MNEPQVAAPPRRWPRRVAWGALVALALLVVSLVLLAFWVARTPSGTAWVVRQVPGLTIDGQRGSVTGGPFEAARVEFVVGGRKITIEQLAWRDLRWQWRPPGGAWVALHAVEPRARRVIVGPAPPAAAREPLREPASLRLPVQARLDGLAIERVELAEGGAPLVNVQAALELGADAGRQHRITRLVAERDRVALSLQGRIDTDAPFALQAEAQLAARAGDTAAPWQATLRAAGPLARPELQAQLAGGAGQRARLDARATLAPFAAWPLAALAATTQGLDLSALASGWPQTQLDGRAEIETSGLDQPMRADVRLVNHATGRWDEGRLPVAMLHAVLQGRADQRDALAFELLTMRLAGDGQVSGAGRWERDRLDATLQLDLVGLRALDARLAALRLGGPIQIVASGLPSPAGGPTPERLQLTAQATLDGRLDGSGHTASLQARIAAERDTAQWRVELPQALLRSGGARAEGQATLTRAHADGAWTAAGRGELAAFDPAVWWPALKAPRAGAHRLDGRWTIDLAGPAALGADPWAALRAARGEAAIDLRPSRLAGVPLTGSARLVAGRAASLQAQLSAGGNNAQVEAQLGAPRERWRARVQAPALQALAPIASLHPALARWWPRAGALDGEFSAEGRWPALATRGQAQARRLAVGEWQAEGADLRWQADLAGSPDAPLQLQLDAAGLAQGTRRLDTLSAQIDGSLRAHRFAFDAASAALRPPAWVAQVQPTAAGSSGTRLRLRGDGGWQRESRDGSGRWQGRVAEAVVRDRVGDASAWIDARDLVAALRFDARGALRELRAEPGRATLLGARLAWRELAWQPGTRVALDAELEPLAVAPWLARLQPEWRWGGDLTVGARAVARQSAADGVVADIVLERRGGDLQLTDDLGQTQSLGLTDLRLALAAQDGTWHFTQAVAGANLGVLAGAQTVRIARDALWPPAEAPLQGVLEWRVDNLAVWAPFAPPGWRLGGRLRTSAEIGGRFGAPEYTGRMTGSGLAARNLLEGIDVRDGELAISLRGPDARIETARFRGGDGELRVTGGASFGEQPRAQLQLVAERFQLLGRFDRRIVTSGSAEISATRDSLRADGRFTVDEGLIDFSRADAPALDSDVVVIRRPASAPAAPAAEPRQAGAAPAARTGPLAQAQVAVEVDLGDKLRVRGRGLDSRLAGRLTISTPGGRLAVNGSVRAVDGTYAAYGQKLEIERGVLRFAGEVATPSLDIVAARPNLDIRVGVVVSGTAANPRVRLFSEPEMSDLDKLSWLVLGRGPDGLGRTDTALLQRAALALLAGEGPGPTDAVLAQLGLDELSVRQTENGEVRDTVITLGKQLSRRWYLGYERGVNATTGTWQLIYRIAQRFTLRAQSGSENSLDLVWTWRWDEPRRREPRMRGERPPP
jgi:translocation and assembly module TamB